MTLPACQRIVAVSGAVQANAPLVCPVGSAACRALRGLQPGRFALSSRELAQRSCVRATGNLLNFTFVVAEALAGRSLAVSALRPVPSAMRV